MNIVLDLFLTFAKIGLFTFGGGYAMISLIENFCVGKKQWINLHDELNEKLRDKSGRIAYLIGLLIICISEVVFSILGNAGIISNHKVIVLYLFVLLLVQIVIGKVAYRQLRKKY